MDFIDRYKKLHSNFLEHSIEINTCPVCQSKDFIDIAKQLIRLLSYLIYYPNGDILRLCLCCGTVMANRIYPPQYYFQYLQMFYGVRPGGRDEVLEKKARIRKDIATDLTKNFSFAPAAVLEVSCYDGSTLDLLAKDMKVDVWGVEPTLSAVDYAEKTYPHLKGKILGSTFEDSRDFCSANSPFDIINLSYCFRQISNPLLALEIILESLSDGGFVLVDEGDLLDDFLSAFDSEYFIRSLYQQKNYYYSLQSLIYLFESHGFEFIRSVRIQEATGVKLTYRGLVFRKTGVERKDSERLRLANYTGQVIAAAFEELAKPDARIFKSLQKYS
jgi:hypothetical protein